jgi:hypothetical protein
MIGMYEVPIVKWRICVSYHDICSKFFPSLFHHSISPNLENLLDSSLEVVFLQLNVEHELELDVVPLFASR